MAKKSSSGKSIVTGKESSLSKKAKEKLKEKKRKEARRINEEFGKMVDKLNAQVFREGNTEEANLASTKVLQGLDNTRRRKVKEALR